MDLEEKRNYCLNCESRPCKNKGCPLQNDIPDFIHEEDDTKAIEVLMKTTVLSAICGRVCPHSSQCQGSCVRGIKGESVHIGEIEAMLGDKFLNSDMKYPKQESNGKKVAIVGGGPSGLTCAAFLAMSGCEVTIYEKYNKLGGLLRHGIPEFRLDREVIDKSIEKILDLGIQVEYNSELGKDVELKDLSEKYDAIYLAIGANEPNITLDGENVLSGNKLLENINLKAEGYEVEIPDFTGKNVAVSGGGNVAMDSARTLKKLGAIVSVVYRRAEEQMPAEKKEIEDAKKDGVIFEFQTNILERIDSTKAKCIRTELVKKEGSDRLVPVNIKGSEFIADFDYIVLATGSKTEENILKSQGLEFDKYGYTKVNDNMQTNFENVFAGGDLVGEKATVAWAARNGRNAANKILEYLK